MARKQRDGQQSGNIMLRNGHWYARVKVKGRQIWRSAPTREAAQKILGELREDIARERVSLPRRARKTLRDFAPTYVEWAKAHKRSWKRDERSLDSALLPALGDVRLADLTKARVATYMQARLQDTISQSRRRRADAPPERYPSPPRKVTAPTVNREVACLRKLLSLAVERGELDANPLRGVRLLPESPGRLPTLTEADEARLLAACEPRRRSRAPDGPGAAPWLPLAVRLAIGTGCRESELLALRWRHVDEAAGAIVVEDSKSGESRRVPLHPELRAELKARRGEPDAPVLICETGAPPTARSVTSAFRAAAGRAGLSGLRFHDLRHVAGTRLLATGANLPEVASFLGHKTLAMSRRYAHTTWTRLADLVSRMPLATGAAGTAAGGGERPGARGDGDTGGDGSGTPEAGPGAANPNGTGNEHARDE